MEYNEYMTMKCVYEKKLTIDEDTLMISYNSPVTLKCFSYGKNIYVRGESSGTFVSAKVYLVNTLVSTGDKIDGQVVKSVNIVPNFNGTIELYECLTWFD